MTTEWQKELCSEYPAEFEKLNETTYIQRKSIKKREISEDSMETDSGFECESRFISNDIFENYINELSSPAHTQISEDFESIKDGQSISDENNLAIMSGLVDIYEQIGLLLDTM